MLVFNSTDILDMTEGCMKAAFLNTEKELYFDDIPVPVPEIDEVLIKLKYTGICGSDLHYYREGRVGDNIILAPHILGHESSGEIVEIGKNVKNINIGDNVTFEPGVPCLECELCRSGRYNLCDKMQFLGAPPYYGTFREFISHKALFTYRLPENVDLKSAALIEPLAVGFNSLSKLKVQPGQKLVITGAGPIGIMAMIVALAMGAHVTITDVDSYRLQLALSLGADQAVDISKSKIKDNNFDYAVEASGNVGAFPIIMNGLKKGAHLVLVGMTSDDLGLKVNTFLKKEIVMHGVYRYANDFQSALRFLSINKIVTETIVSHNYKFDELVEAFKFVDNPESEKMKVMIRY
jgi:L-iditol 2-dehydrogenase